MRVVRLAAVSATLAAPAMAASPTFNTLTIYSDTLLIGVDSATGFSYAVDLNPGLAQFQGRVHTCAISATWGGVKAVVVSVVAPNPVFPTQLQYFVSEVVSSPAHTVGYQALVATPWAGRLPLAQTVCSTNVFAKVISFDADNQTQAPIVSYDTVSRTATFDALDRAAVPGGFVTLK